MPKRRAEPFIERWSRRKHAARQGVSLPESPVAAEMPAPGSTPPLCSATVGDAPPPELPSLDSLRGIASDYRDFMRPEVDAATRTAALKKLFFDPHFNQMDGLDVYIDDYGKLETLPSSTLRLLDQARQLGLFQEDEKKAEGETPELAAPEPTPPAELSATPALESPAEPAANSPGPDT